MRNFAPMWSHIVDNNQDILTRSLSTLKPTTTQQPFRQSMKYVMASIDQAYYGTWLVRRKAKTGAQLTVG